jgi:hypothetical protein
MIDVAVKPPKDLEMPAVKVKSVDSLEAYISLVEKLRSKRSKRLWYPCEAIQGLFVEA